MANTKQDNPQFGGARFGAHGASQPCAQCEAMLADVLDGTLTMEEQAQFDLHIATCVSCASMLADAQRGAAWLEMLRTPRPEPSPALLERILAQTAGKTVAQSVAEAAGLPTLAPVGGQTGFALIEGSPRGMGTVLPVRRRVAAAFHRNSFGHAILQPRLAMTAAMAFFSIGLTLNLTGVRLNELRAASLKPSNLRRSFYQADAHLVRYYTNLRVVYELESRVRDLQRATEQDVPSDSEKKPVDDSKDKHPAPGAGTSRRQMHEAQSLDAFNFTEQPSLLPANTNRILISCLSFCRNAQEGELV